jgi:hypothetical protein
MAVTWKHMWTTWLEKLRKKRDSYLAETFDNLRKFRMKLNHEKCIFGVPSGKLLGYIIF